MARFFAIVHPAAGDVSLLLTQMLSVRGVRVLGIASNHEKRTAVPDVGAEATADYEDGLRRCSR